MSSATRQTFSQNSTEFLNPSCENNMDWDLGLITHAFIVSTSQTIFNVKDEVLADPM